MLKLENISIIPLYWVLSLCALLVCIHKSNYPSMQLSIYTVGIEPNGNYTLIWVYSKHGFIFNRGYVPWLEHGHLPSYLKNLLAIVCVSVCADVFLFDEHIRIYQFFWVSSCLNHINHFWNRIWLCLTTVT